MVPPDGAGGTCRRAAGLGVVDQLRCAPRVRVLQGARVFEALGTEAGTLVFDAHSGFDPDAFGAASGALRWGGLLLLLTPLLDEW